VFEINVMYIDDLNAPYKMQDDGIVNCR